jgi:hypothetical protein
MAALRDWSIPGRRADLVAAAWQAGETNIVALAEAARTSRPTVYADLRSRGIDPDDRPKENTVIAPVVIEGIDGLDQDQGGRWHLDSIHRWVAEHPDEDASTEGFRLLALFDTLRRYNTLRPLLQTEQSARADRDRALHLVETRWEALSTAAAWPAAHHSYVVAVDGAHTAIDAWEKEATAAKKVEFVVHGEERAAAYEQILGAGHPSVEPLAIDPAAVAQELHEDLDRRHERRKQLAAQTLGVAQPAAQ